MTVILLIHLQASWRASNRNTQTVATIPISQLQKFFPEAKSLDEIKTDNRFEVLNSAGEMLGSYLQTSPASDHLIGFSGPTNLLIALDTEDRIIGLRVISSSDTREHVQQVVDNGKFLNSYTGLSQEEATKLTNFDAVTGATLTSMAIHEALLHRLGGNQVSLRFPEPPHLKEVKPLFPTAIAIEKNPSMHSQWIVLGKNQKQLGFVLRTSPEADIVIGYQGPTETLIGFGAEGFVKGMLLRKSYDNEPYVSYVREDNYFSQIFNEYSLDELATLDITTAEVEGVSGATMTSVAVAQGVIQAADNLIRSRQQTIRKWKTYWTWRDLGTAVTIFIGCLLAFTSMKSKRWLRIGFRILIIVYLGLINGDMLSQAMVAGWAQHGVPWRTAGGLVLLTLVAFLVPIGTRRNIYCTHLCPHGAAQQIIKNRLGWRLKIPRRIIQLLKKLPGLLLIWCVIVVMWPLPISLIGIEPFDAWVFYVAGVATITVAVVGLLASMIIPMAYCRYGCPTGALLGFLRFNSHSDQWSSRDWFAVGLLSLAICLYCN